MAAPARGLSDTDAKTMELYVELYRKMTPGERARIEAGDSVAHDPAQARENLP